MTETVPDNPLLVGLASFAGSEALSVGKDGENKHFGYRFMTEPSLFEAARQALAAAGLSATISFEGGMHESIITVNKDGKESPAIMATVTARLTIRDQSGHQVEATAYGQGVDPADKAYAKAMTMASKYCVQKGLLIGVEADDTDGGDSGTVRGGMTGVASEKQLGFLCGLIKKVGIDGGNAERMALRLARMAGDSATEFAKISKAAASDLIERLQKVEKNPAAAAVIAERLAAFETERGYSADPAADAAPLAPIDPNPQTIPGSDVPF